MRMTNWNKFGLGMLCIALAASCSIATSMDATIDREIEAATRMKEASKTPTPAANENLIKVKDEIWLGDKSIVEYDGEPLTDVRIYLTNVNASCKYLKKDGFSPEMIVNPGFLDMDALSGFKDRSLLYADTEDIGEETLYPGIKLFCYPNDSPEETPGSPFTRLVIEGKISGHTYWYPVTINRGDFGIASGGDGKGIGRNMCYTYDFTILRTGTSDPDIPVCKDDISVTCMVEPWKEMENETVTF